MRKLILFIAVGILAAVGIVSGATAKSGTSPDAAERRAKARYYFLEGAEASAGDDIGTAYALFKKAYETDTTYDEAAYAYASYQMYLIPQDGSEESQKAWERTVNLRRKMIDAYPGDYAVVRLYAQQLMGADPMRSLNGKPAAYEAVRVLERLDSIGAPSAYHLLQLSGAYSALEMPDSVLGALARFERREGSSVEVLENKVGFLFQSGATDRAVKEIEAYRKTHPREDYPVVLLSMLKYASGDIDSTFYYLEEAERLNPMSFDVKERIAMLAFERGDTVKYKNKVFETLESSDGIREAKISLLTQLLGNLDREKNSDLVPEIRNAITSLHGQYPQDSQLYLIEGAFESELENYDKGLELIRSAVSLNPEDEITRTTLIQSLLKQKREDEALEEIKKTWSEVGPLSSMRSLGIFLALNKEDYPQALEFLESSLKKITGRTSLTEPISLQEEFLKNLDYNQFMDLSSIYQEAGDVYNKLGEVENMRLSFENALVLGPNVPLTLNNYAYYLALDGSHLDRALELSDRAVTLEPGNPTYTDTHAWVLFRRGETQAAENEMAETIASYDRTIEAVPDLKEETEKEMVEALIHYGATLWVNGKHDEARIQWERALAADPENTQIPGLLKEGWKESK